MTQVTDADWVLFRETLQAKVEPSTWQRWLAALDCQDQDSEILKLHAPSQFHLKWILDKHLTTLEDAAQTVFGSEVRIELEADDEDDLEILSLPRTVIATPGPDQVNDQIIPAAAPREGRLLARYTFDNFIVGPSNRFAHAAAMAVTEQPGTHYNPLFIYGAAGLGKTHLLHAVGHHAIELQPRTRIRYITSENFFNQFIDGIRRKRMDEFKSQYRTTDLLLLDDVQFFEGKEQILEEFFHTFNALYEQGKQMVISSDRHPRNLATLEDRLRSRFEWGLLTDIHPPDVETRLAILRKNTDGARHEFPEDVLEFIATHVENNIRELEGALTRVTAFATLHHTAVDLTMATDVLRDLVPPSAPRPLTPDDIMRAVAVRYNFSMADLTGKSRKAPLALARQIAMYICRELTDLSLPNIGRLFGGRDHTTVMHAVAKVKLLMEQDPEVFDGVTALSKELRTT